ncbi:Spc7 kinetochore protein-domain-containing protein [Coprinopsis sp. MPI-PUGE-AT-0042]|nr:Spc7 kinetochore protein-domain-containing protein [Coprinopsis sp. MPI-PUGE-AT-0042]
MVVTKDSPNRRRSIAGTSHGSTTAIPRRRRAYSVAPRTSLSPQAKARRMLVPRKSILKASFTAEDVEEETQSMELTTDFRAKIHDNASRKSLGFNRRVSFAEHAHVRVFQIPDKDHTTSTVQSSPSSASSSEPDLDVEPEPEVELEPEPARQINDENDYPGANFARKRRSSVRYSIGSDMDLTTVGDSFDVGAAILDEDFDDMPMDMAMSDDMEVTQAFPAGIRRRSSVAPARRETLGHPPSAILEMDEEADQSLSSVAEDSLISEGDEGPEGEEEEGNRSERMEFTVPMGRSLRPPPEEDPAWLALRQATHSGDTSIEPQEDSFDEDNNQGASGRDMPLESAFDRLMKARASLSRPNTVDDDTTGTLEDIQEDTISSVESMDNGDHGNRTMNLSKVMARFSLGGGANSRMSMGGEADMDESEVYGNIAAAGPSRQSLAPSEPRRASQPPPPPAPAPAPAPPPISTVFSAPPPAAAPKPAAKQTVHAPAPRVFQPPASPAKSRPFTVFTSPSKAKSPKPTFTAAFAPPASKTSPKKVPAKRLQRDEHDTENVDADKPSPAKRPALAGASKLPTLGSAPARPSPLTPSQQSRPQAPASAQRPASSQRPPSGYMARRKSLALGGASNAAASPRTNPVQSRRMSLASGPQDAWKRFDKAAPLPKKPTGTPQSSQTLPEPERVPSPSRVEPTEEPMDEEEPEREPSPERRSPSPAAMQDDEPTTGSMDFPRPGVTRNTMDEGEPSSQDKAERWRAGVEEGNYEDDDVPAISIGQFFEMTNIKFMDEIAAPRRSMHPGQQPLRRPRAKEEVPLAEYAVAMAIDIPQLELYTRVSRDLEAWMEKSKIGFAEAEEEAAKVTPELFVEYSRADEEGQAELLHQLNFIKTNARGSAKSDWYDWKLKWVEGLKMTADQAFNDLEADAKKLEQLSVAASELIPDLEKEYESILAELEREQAEVAEIEASDQDYLNELKGSIAEQNIEVEALKAEVQESRDQLVWLNGRLRETEQQKQEISASITKAERILQIQKSSTRTEVFHLKDELESLEGLHLTRIIRVSAQVFEYIYDSTYCIVVPCTNFVPNITKVSITRLEHARASVQDDFPKLTNLFVACASQSLDEVRDTTIRQVVYRLNDYWTSCSQLRQHLRLLSVKYPLEVEITPPSTKNPTPTFRARATLMFPKVKGKALASFIFNLQTFSKWPLSIDSLDCEVQAAYGPLDRSAILKAIVDRLAQATPSDNYALLDSCIDAQALYSS